MPHSERVRKRVLRLQNHVKFLKAQKKDTKAFEAELKRLVTGKQQKTPVGAGVSVKRVGKRRV